MPCGQTYPRVREIQVSIYTREREREREREIILQRVEKSKGKLRFFSELVLIDYNVTIISE